MKTLFSIAMVLIFMTLAIGVSGCSTPAASTPPPPSTTSSPTSTPTPSPTPDLASYYSIKDFRAADKTLASLGLTASTFPALDGATSTQPIRSLIAAQTFGAPYSWYETPDEEMFIHADFYHAGLTTIELAQISQKIAKNSKTHEAYMSLIQGKIDLILVSTLPSDDELKEAQKLGVKLELFPIGQDGFVFLVNQNNPLQSLNTADIKDIYTGKIDNWKQFTGQDAPITAFTRQPNSGSQELMDKLLMKGIPLSPVKPTSTPPMELMMKTMSILIWGVEKDENSIGYSLYYYKNNMIDKRDKMPKVKLIAVDGVEPNPENIRTHKYPYVFNIYAVTRADQPQDSPAYRIKEWLTSPEGHEIIVKAGYVGLE